jgi:hypothetical protein
MAYGEKDARDGSNGTTAPGNPARIGADRKCMFSRSKALMSATRRDLSKPTARAEVDGASRTVLARILGA